MPLWPFGMLTKETPGLGRVLVVDDEENVRKIVRLTLTKAGYDVEEAEDGGKAIEVLNTGENPLMVDVIICDIRMPRINGVEAIENVTDSLRMISVARAARQTSCSTTGVPRKIGIIRP